MKVMFFISNGIKIVDSKKLRLPYFSKIKKSY